MKKSRQRYQNRFIFGRLLPIAAKTSSPKVSFRTTLLSNTYPFDIVNKLAPVQAPAPIERNRLQRLSNRSSNLIIAVSAGTKLKSAIH